MKRIFAATSLLMLGITSYLLYDLQQDYFPEEMKINGEERPFDKELINLIDIRNSKTHNFALKELPDYEIEADFKNEHISYVLYERETYYLIQVKREERSYYVEAKKPEQLKTVLKKYPVNKEIEEAESSSNATDIINNDFNMYGTVLDVNNENNTVTLNISDWVNRDAKGAVEDMMHTYTGTITVETTILHQDENKTTDITSLLRGQKVSFNVEDVEGHAGELKKLRLNIMSKEEIYNGFLAHGDNKYHVVVLYEYGNMHSDFDVDKFDSVLPESFKGGISWHEYNEDFVVDYKTEFELEKLPVVLVFDKEGLVQTAYKLEELRNLFE